MINGTYQISKELSLFYERAEGHKLVFLCAGIVSVCVYIYIVYVVCVCVCVFFCTYVENSKEDMSCFAFENLTQTSVTREEELSNEELPPLGWPEDSSVGIFLIID